MAGKKKKKLAANPARGFATISLPSNAKHHPSPDAESAPNAEGAGNANEGVSADAAGASSTAQAATLGVPDTNAMNPEEYEVHLEQAKLDMLVDSNASRVKSDASRQATNLKNERRQLRSSSDPVFMPNFDENMVSKILENLPDCGLMSLSETAPSKASKLDEDDLLLKLWTLDQTLSQLQMPVVDEALAHVLESWHSAGFIPSSEVVAGLDEALRWYAHQRAPSELPNYETGKLQAEESADFPHEEVIQARSEAASTNDTEDIQETAAENHPIDTRRTKTANSYSVDRDRHCSLETGQSCSDSDVVGDDDDDPEKLVDFWLKLQRSKFRHDHQLVKSRRGDSMMERRSVDDKLRRIEQDVLFDPEQAQQQWKPVLRELQVELGRFQKKSRRHDGSSKDQSTSEAPEAPVLDADDLLSGMFNEEAEDTEVSAPSEDFKLVETRDFGVWSGIHPKRLLEEAGADLIKPNGLKFKSIVATSYSSRLQLDVNWAIQISPSQLTQGILPEVFAFVADASKWTLRMDLVATKSTTQSEAYLATLVLFILISEGHVSSKITQRLPKLWKEVFADLEKARNQAIARQDMQRLREMRSMLSQTQSKTASESRMAGAGAPMGPNAWQLSRKPFKRESPEALTQIWAQRATSSAYKKMLTSRKELPVFAHKQEILKAIEANQILIICADTGAGKSTQVPSYVLESQLGAGNDYNILVTQPRRISAISIARRVSAELGEPQSALGTSRSLVGFAIRLESKTSSSTRLTFATTGVLLRMIQDSSNLEDIDCLVLDEVHERTMDLDLLFIALKRLCQRRSSLKVVLMSATVDASKFSTYFDGAPVLSIPGRTFPVTVGYLEDAMEETLGEQRVKDPHTNSEPVSAESSDYEGEDDSKDVAMSLTDYSPAVRKAIGEYDHSRIDYELIMKLATAIATKPKYIAYSSAMLIFMPGLGEIRRLYNLITTSAVFSSSWRIHMLHSSFSTDELEQAFLIPPKGQRKIVIATNIAETGITIPDVTAVIDTCKEKVMRFDERRQLSRLTEGLISRASARQRKGRAARVREGLCFHLVTRKYYDNKMPEQATPEMLRLSLQDPVLRVKIWDLGPIEEVLLGAIDPPSSKNIRRAIAKLQEVGALGPTERLTALGVILARLPLDVVLGKMAVFGVVFRCLDAVLTTIASFSTKSVFIEKEGTESSSKAQFARGDSDFLTLYNAYSGWKKACKAGTGHSFCKKYQLSQSQLQQLEEQKVQLLVYLADANLVQFEPEEIEDLHRARYSKSQTTMFEVPARYNALAGDATITAAIVVALYPRILKREGQGYRNIYSNQQLQVASTSVNKVGKAPPWLAYLEATQAKNGKVNAFHTSRITPAIFVLLLGEAEFKIFAGVVELDHGRARFSCRNWKQMLAIQYLRFQIARIVSNFLERRNTVPSTSDQRWLDLLRIAIDGPSLQTRSQLK